MAQFFLLVAVYSFIEGKRDFNSGRAQTGKVREFVYARILSCFPISSTLYCYVNAKNIFKKRRLCLTVVVDLVKVEER